MAGTNNKTAYDVEFDNLVLPAVYPTMRRVVEVEADAEVKRGGLIALADGKYVPASESATDIVAIAAEDIAPEGGKAAADVFVAGAFAAAHVSGVEVTEAVKQAAQKNNIYLI